MDLKATQDGAGHKKVDSRNTTGAGSRSTDGFGPVKQDNDDIGRGYNPGTSKNNESKPTRSEPREIPGPVGFGQPLIGGVGDGEIKDGDVGEDGTRRVQDLDV